MSKLCYDAPMSILSVVIVLCVVGVLLYCVNTYLPMQPPFKTLVNVVVVVAVVLWLLSAFGVLSSISGARLPRVR
jgi:type IV secretory pathway TrbL component